MNPVLILDDDWNRHKSFKAHFEARGVPTIHVATTGAAIEALERHRTGERPLSAVSLDHDLGEYGPQEYDAEKKREYTGHDVSQWMCKNLKPDLPVRIHSWNIHAGKRMEDGLREAGFDVHSRPFKMKTSSGDFDAGSEP